MASIGDSASDRSRSGGLKDPKARRAGSQRSGWRRSGRYTDIVYQTWDGIAKITINRPEVRNAFRPTTVLEMSRAFAAARDDPKIGVVILTGAGTEAFCSGGDQRIRGDDGYLDPKGTGRLNGLDLQAQIRRQLRWRIWSWLAGAHRRPEEGARDLVPLRAVR